VTIREATTGDRERLRELYTEFANEMPSPPGIPVDIEHELGELDDYLGDQNVALVAEDESGRVVGFSLARMEHPGIGHLSDIYVVPEARRQGAARELIRAAATRLREGEDATVLTLGVQVTNEDARTAYERLGFQLDRAAARAFRACAARAELRVGPCADGRRKCRRAGGTEVRPAVRPLRRQRRRRAAKRLDNGLRRAL
jgi:ribosomal protein S18 acetylase RimI-like enzyme